MAVLEEDAVIAALGAAAVEAVPGGGEGVVAGGVIVELVVVAPGEEPGDPERFHVLQCMGHERFALAVGIIVPEVTGDGDEVGLVEFDEAAGIFFGFCITVGSVFFAVTEEVEVRELEQADFLGVTDLECRGCLGVFGGGGKSDGGLFAALGEHAGMGEE